MVGRRCAEWRFATPKQQRAEDVARRMAEAQLQRAVVTDEEAWWDAVLRDPRAEATRKPIGWRTLAELRASEFRVECLKCFRAVAITRQEALARYDGGSLWREVAMRLLADGCPHRTGRHEEDGCWPDMR